MGPVLGTRTEAAKVYGAKLLVVSYRSCLSASLIFVTENASFTTVKVGKGQEGP
jgi:hypothetical protein